MLLKAMLAGLAGAAAGVACLGVLTAVASAAGERLWGIDPRRDGQFVLVYVFALPVGAIIGASSGSGLAFWCYKQRRLGGGLCLAPALAVLLAFVTWVWPDLAALASPWAAVPVGASLMGCLMGAYLLWRSPSDR